MKIFDNFLGLNAEKHLDITKLDYNLINVLKQHSELLKSLDNWLLISDKNLILDLIKLNEIIKKKIRIKNLKFIEVLV